MSSNDKFEQILITEILNIESVINMIANKVFIKDPDLIQKISEMMSGVVDPDDENRIWDFPFNNIPNMDSKACCIVASVNIYKAKVWLLNGDFSLALNHLSMGSYYAGGAADHQDGINTRSEKAKKAINSKHDKPGGSRDLKKKINAIWATGKYASKDICAEEEYAALGYGSFSAARKALRESKTKT